MSSIYFEKDNLYLALEYEYEISGSEGITDRLIIPNYNLEVNVRLILNGRHLKSNHYNGLCESIGSNFLQFQVWKDLEYNTSLFIAEDYSFCMKLNCLVFPPLENDFREFDSCNTLRSITITIRFVTDKVQIILTDLINGVNLLLASLILALEIQFPLCFSFYGRKFFKVNYNQIVRVLNEVLDFELPRQSKVIKKENASIEEKTIQLQRLIKNLQSRILLEYNTLDIWREYNIKRMRWKSYEEFRLKQEDNDDLTKKSLTVKLMIYSFSFLVQQCVENNLQNDEAPIQI